MVLVTCLVVIMRYGLDMGSVFLQDVVLYLHGGLFLLGAAFALKRGAHVRVDIFYRNFSNIGFGFSVTNKRGQTSSQTFF